MKADLSTKLVTIEQWVVQAFRQLSEEAQKAGADCTEESGPGARYSFGRGRMLCRLHPKLTHLAIGLPEDARTRVAEHFTVRAQKGAVWFNVTNRDHVEAALDLVRHAFTDGAQ